MEEKKRAFTKIENGQDQVKMNGDDIMYLLLIQGDPKYDEAPEFRDWIFITGRQAAYDYIIQLLESDHTEDFDNFINIEQSKIYADNPHIPEDKNKLRLSNGFSFYQFIKDVTVLSKVKVKEGFDIEEYRQISAEEAYGESNGEDEEE